MGHAGTIIIHEYDMHAQAAIPTRNALHSPSISHFDCFIIILTTLPVQLPIAITIDIPEVSMLLLQDKLDY